MKIALLGDIAFFGINTVNTNDWKKRFDGIKNVLDSCDYVVGNLETPLTHSKKTIGGKSAYIKGSPQDVEILKYLGVTHVTLANNHIFDYRLNGLKDTINCLDTNGISWYGINGHYSDIVNGNNKIRLLGYCCYSTNAAGLEAKKNYINLLNPIDMERDIRISEKLGYIPVLSCHWGQEHVHYPDRNHVDLSRMLAERHSIIIHGHHPHVIQGIEKVGNSLIMYSLGNFCFDDVYTKKSEKPLVKLSKDNQESFICILDIKDNLMIDYKIIPFSFENGAYSVNNEFLNKINKWSEFLSVSEEQYNFIRGAEINDYIQGRKKQRDLEWFLKRLNFDSFLMIQNGRKNDRRYNEIMGKLREEKGKIIT